MTEQNDPALAGLKVLDITDEPGQLTGRILADLGAEVLKIEPPGGDALRKRGPFIGGEPHPDCGAQWVARNLGKRSLVLDLTQAAGAQRLRDLARQADVLIESFAPGRRSTRAWWCARSLHTDRAVPDTTCAAPTSRRWPRAATCS